MKRVISVLVLLLVILKLHAQTEKIYSMPDKMPLFPNGEKGLLKFLAQNIKYPVKAIELGFEGVVVVNFIIKSDGTIDSIKILKSVPGGCDEEVIRVLKLMPKWEPGYMGQKPVSVYFNLPVMFSFNNDDSSKDSPIVFKNKATWDEFLDNHLKYPKSVKSEMITGDVVVSFIVNENNDLIDIKILKSIGPEFNSEVMRVLKLSKKYWKAATQNSKPIRSEKIITIHF